MADEDTSLKVLIVGGGIGGLAAAIALRRQGHHVEIYEQSRMASEIGAAICVFPNADSVLKRMGVDVGDCGANLDKQIRYITAAGKVLQVADVEKEAHRWQASTRAVHRAHIHEHLKETALSSEGNGPPAQLHKATRIEKVDADNATIVLTDGTTIQGDVLVGADGIHSVCRAEVSPSIQPFKTNHSAFRFLVTRKAALENPATKELASTLGSMDMWYAEDRKVVMYPCADNTLLNFVCIHPAELSDAAATADYDTSASKEKLLEVFQAFEPAVQAFLQMAQPGTIKVWPLFDMKQLPTFVRGRMALIGDAAHPFLPHLGQGGAQAIEDGVALGTMLPRSVDKAEVPTRIQLYNEARHERASNIQTWTRLAGMDGANDDQESIAEFAVAEAMEKAMSHDEYHHSTQILRRHERRQQAAAPLGHPILFGSAPIAQQPSFRTKCQTATITFKTSATLLRNLFPNEAYMFKTRDTVAYASLRVQTFENVPWLGGHSYHSFGLYVHNVLYKENDGSTVEGTYMPVMFQDDVESIMSDRQDLGLPKLYCSIETQRDKDNMVIKLGWRGTTWGRLELTSLIDGKQTKGDVFRADQLLIHKYVPSKIRQGQMKPDADYAVLLDTGFSHSNDSIEHREVSQGNSSFHFDAHDWKQLPTLHHVVSHLAELPVFDVVGASVENTAGRT